MKLEKAIFIFIICSMLILLVWVKILGTYVPSPVDKQGYCKITYGDSWRYNKEKNVCYYRTEQIPFTENEFKEKCSKPNFISLQVWSDCFKANKGDYIS